MAFNQQDSLAEQAARYKAQKNESIFGEEDCVKPAAVRSAPQHLETSGRNVAPVETSEQDEDESEDEPKIYEVTEDAANDEENDAPNAPAPEVPQVRQ